MALAEDLEQAAAVAAGLAEDGEQLEGIVPAEAEPGQRTYLCAYIGRAGRRWLVLAADGEPVTNREAVRRTATITAVCELAEESAGGGELEELRERLVAIRLTESPPGIEEAEEAALALERTIEPPPRLAEPGYLDRVGAAIRRLEQALGDSAASPFAEAMKTGMASVEELADDVEASYKLPLG